MHILGQRREQSRAQRKRSVTIAAVTGVALVILTAGVFSVAAASQRVTVRAASVHLYDEAIRGTSLARAQVGFGLVISDLSVLAEVDVANDLVASNERVEATLQDLDDVIALLRSGDHSIRTETLTSVGHLATAVVDLRDVGSSGLAGASDQVTAFEQAYSSALDMLQTDRDAALERLENDDAALGRLGTLVSFFVAFVAPTVAIFLYRELTRPQRAMVETDARLAIAQVRAVTRHQLTDRVHNELLGLLEGGNVSAAAARLGEHQTLVSALDGNHNFSLTSNDVTRVLDDVIRGGEGISAPVEVTVAASDPCFAWTDSALLSTVVRAVLRDSLTARAGVVGITVRRAGVSIEIRLSHDGSQRSAPEVRSMLDLSSLADRLAILRGAGSVDIAVAMELTATIQGRFDIETSGADNVVVIQLPASEPSSTVSPSPKATAHSAGA